jgi:exopolyphosphatase/guanosine-5'-triphosphate,3'-diphosphate pyrophosphatase
MALRLAFTLCAATPGMLPKTKLEIDKENVILTVPRRYEPLLGEVVQKRLTALARALNRKGETRVGK